MSNLEKRRKMHKLLCDGLINYNGNRADGIPFHFDIPESVPSDPVNSPHKFSTKKIEVSTHLGNWDNLEGEISPANIMITTDAQDHGLWFPANQDESDKCDFAPTLDLTKEMVHRANFKAKRGVDVDHLHITIGASDLRSSDEKATHEIMTDLLRGGTDIEIFWYDKYVDGLR